MKKITFSFIYTMIAYYADAQQPTFEWAKAIQDSTVNGIVVIDVNDSGDVFTAGNFSGTVDFDPGPGIFNLTSIGLYDLFICKFNSSCNFLWAKNIGGSNGFLSVRSIKVDAFSNVYTTGMFDSTADFDPSISVHNLTASTTLNTFICKLDSDGNYVWAKNFECSGGSNYGQSIAVDNMGSVYTTGLFQYTTDFDPGPSVYNLTAGNYDIFVSKLDSSGNFIWAKAMTGTSGAQGESIVVDNAGNPFICGTYNGTVDFDPNAGTYNATSVGNYDIFICKLDSFGNFVWVKTIGIPTTGGGEGRNIALDNTGHIYSVGYYRGTVDFNPNAGVYNLISSSAWSTYVLKLDTSGNFIWAKTLAQNGPDIGFSIAVDDYDNVYIPGEFPTPNDFDPSSGSYILTPLLQDSYICKLDSSGNLAWVISMGGIASYGGALGISLDAANNVYAIGNFTNTVDFDPSASIHNLTAAATSGSGAFYIHKMGQCGSGSISISLTGTLLSTATSAVSYQWIKCEGNIFITGATSQTYNAIANGNYAVVVVFQNGCTDTSSCVNVTGVGMNDIHTLTGIFITPNPTIGIIKIISQLTHDNSVIHIFNSIGQTMLSKEIKSLNTNIDISTFANGIYYIEIIADNKTFRTKLVKH